MFPGIKLSSRRRKKNLGRELPVFFQFVSGCDFRLQCNAVNSRFSEGLENIVIFFGKRALYRNDRIKTNYKACNNMFRKLISVPCYYILTVNS